MLGKKTYQRDIADVKTRDFDAEIKDVAYLARMLKDDEKFFKDEITYKEAFELAIGLQRNIILQRALIAGYATDHPEPLEMIAIIMEQK